MENFYIVLVTILFCLIGYGFGSVLFGPLASKIFKVDVRSIGSGNPGATNIYRTLGLKVAFPVALLDAMKSYVAVIVCWAIFKYTIHDWNPSENLYCLVFVGGTAAVIGHCFPPKYICKMFSKHWDDSKCIQYRGGKGVATTGAVIFAISPWLGLMAFAIWVSVILLTKYVSLASMLCMTIASFLIFVPELDYIYLFSGSLLFPKEMIVTYEKDLWLMIVLFIVTMLNNFIMVYRHKENIKRLINRNEKRIWGNGKK